MRTLIVGCGYIGKAVGAELAIRGHEVFGVRRTAQARDELKTVGIVSLEADITKPQDLARLPTNYDWVVNCVSSSGGGADDYQSVYLGGMRNLIQWLSGWPPKKFVYTSSTSVYAQTDGSIVTESSPTEPSTDTGRILLQTEKALLAAAAEDFPAVILRVAGIYGPGRGYWLKQFLTGEAKIENKGERILNMIHRDDVAGATIAALEKGQAGEIYNVVDNEPVAQLELFKGLAAMLGRDMPPFAAEKEQTERKRGLTSKRVSNEKLKAKLGYGLKYPTFREGFTASFETKEATNKAVD